MQRHVVPSGLATALLLAACNLFSTYAAEVGYHAGEDVKWEIWGDFRSFDDCRSAAMARFNEINHESPRRAVSWACLKKSSDGGYESRHR
jgi:hypothetical protein